jgi:hypothetical protein
MIIEMAAESITPGLASEETAWSLGEGEASFELAVRPPETARAAGA